MFELWKYESVGDRAGMDEEEELVELTEQPVNGPEA